MRKLMFVVALLLTVTALGVNNGAQSVAAFEVGPGPHTVVSAD